jgi:heme exporter protein D
MYFDSFGAALNMDGHGVFVWSAYLIALLVVAVILIAPVRRKRRFLRHLGGELKRAQGSPTVSKEGK